MPIPVDLDELDTFAAKVPRFSQPVCHQYLWPAGRAESEMGRSLDQQAEGRDHSGSAYQLPTTANDSLEPRLTVKDCPRGQATCTDSPALIWRRMDFDRLGRLAMELLRLPTTPGLGENQRTITYNAMGQRRCHAFHNLLFINTYALHSAPKAR